MSSKHAAHRGMVRTVRGLSDILQKARKSGPKTSRQLERHLKGVANHWRIEILMLIARNEWITLDEIAIRLSCNIKTLSEHTSKLLRAGLIHKKYIGRNVGHALTPYGKTFYNFLRTF